MKFLFLAKILLLRKLERNRQEKQPITHNQTIITSELTTYSHTGQYDHILFTHSLYPEYFTQKRKLERNRQEKQPITHNQTIIT